MLYVFVKIGMANSENGGLYFFFWHAPVLLKSHVFYLYLYQLAVIGRKCIQVLTFV